MRPGGVIQLCKWISTMSSNKRVNAPVKLDRLGTSRDVMEPLGEGRLVSGIVWDNTDRNSIHLRRVRVDHIDKMALANRDETPHFALTLYNLPNVQNQATKR